jgi:hypothetical protein
MMVLYCLAYLNQDGAVRCGLPADARCRFTTCSADRPLEHAMTRCPAGHYLNGPVESLTWDTTDHDDPGTAGLGHDGRHGGGGCALREFPAQPERNTCRLNTASGYYPGRRATLRITAMRPRRRPAASRCLTEAAVSGGSSTRVSR